MTGLALRRLFASHAFFVAVTLGLVLVTAVDVVEVLGARPAQIVRRNTEAVVMVLAPWYWLLFSGGRDLAGRGGAKRPVRVARQWVWLAAWGAAAVVLQAVALGWVDLELPGRIVTLGEATAVVAVINLYLALTRRLLSTRRGEQEPGVVPAPLVRAGLFVLLGVMVVGVHLAGPDVVPVVVDDLVRLNVELFAGVLLLGLVVDVVAVPPTTTRRVAWWCVAMIAIPVAVSVGDGAGLPAGLADWTSRATEAFLAAAVVAAWFHNWQQLRVEAT